MGDERREVEELAEGEEALAAEVEELSDEVADLEHPPVGHVVSVTIVSAPLTTAPKGPTS